MLVPCIITISGYLYKSQVKLKIKYFYHIWAEAALPLLVCLDRIQMHVTDLVLFSTL